MEILAHRVSPEQAGRRLLSLLKQDFFFSRTLLRRLKAHEGVRVNGEPRFLYELVREGDLLSVVLPDEPSEGVLPEEMPLSILYEDEDLILLDKPAGVVVHPTKGTYSGTLANGLAWLYEQRGIPFRCFPVHRIDKETSGLVLFAKNPLACDRLSRQLKENKLGRRYLALAEGLVQPGEGCIDAPIERDPDHPRRRVGVAGQAARTHYRVLSRQENRTWLGLRLETGRTHQIRVHLASIGHPLVGDSLYGAGEGRHFLHAWTLDFLHPRTGQPVSFRSPLPSDMELLALPAGLLDAFLLK